MRNVDVYQFQLYFVFVSISDVQGQLLWDPKKNDFYPTTSISFVTLSSSTSSNFVQCMKYFDVKQLSMHME